MVDRCWRLHSTCIGSKTWISQLIDLIVMIEAVTRSVLAQKWSTPNKFGEVFAKQEGHESLLIPYVRASKGQRDHSIKKNQHCGCDRSLVTALRIKKTLRSFKF